MVGNLRAGRELLRSLERSIRDARSRADQVHVNLDKLDDFIEELLAERGNSLVELAKHYLPDISGSTVAKQFVEVRSQLQDLLRKKQAHEQQLQQAWDANLDRRSQLETQIDELTQLLDELAARRDELQSLLAERLKQHQEFRQLSEQALAAETELKRNELRVAEMREEVAEKLPAYEQSRLFQYLYQRGYGTADYKARGLTKQLDGWVAKLVKYHKNRQSYNFLRVTPELMAAEVDRRRADFNGLMEQIESIEDKISDEIGLTEVQKQGSELGDQRESALAEVKELEEARASIEADQSRLAANQNEYHEAGVNKVKEFLGSMEESALAVRTRTTPETTDDALFAEIRRCNQQLREARQQSKDDRQLLELWHEKISGLDQVVRRFRSAEYDSMRSYFSPRLNIDGEIDRYLQGQNTTQGLWNALRQHQRFIRPEFDDSWDDMDGIFDSDVSHVLGRVLIEVAGQAMRHAAQRGMHRRGPQRQQTRRSTGRPTYRRNGGFTSGKGF